MSHRRLAGAIVLLAATTAAQERAPLPEVPSPSLLAGDVATGGIEHERRARIEEALRTRAYDRAEALLLEAIDQEPRAADLLRALGGVFFVRGRHLNAAVAFKKAETLAPLDERSRFTLAMAYVVMGRRDWARPELDQLGKSASGNALYAYWRARLDFDDQHFAAAVGGFLRATTVNPRLAKAHDSLGLSYEALGRYEDAIRSFQEAIRLNREDQKPSPWPPLNLGLLLLKLDRLDEAESLFRESQRFDPRFPEGHFQLGVVLEKKGRVSEAVHALEAAAELDVSYPDPHYALARLYRRAGDPARADRALDRFQVIRQEKKDGQARAVVP